jgi:hypothetical protein
MSVTDAIVWFLPPLAGVALGLRMLSSALAILLGFVLVLASVVVWGYSWNYPNGACEPGEPCPTGDRVIQVVTPVLFLLGSFLFLIALARSLWNDFRAGRWRGQSGQARLGHGRKSDSRRV